MLKSYLRGAFSVFCIRIVGIGLAFGLQVFFARVLGAEGYGEYIYVYTWITVLAILSRLGLDTSLVRFVAAHVSTGEGPGLRETVWRTVSIAATTGAALAATGLIIVWLWPGHGGLRPIWTWALFLLPLLGVTFVAQGILRGLRRVGLAEVPYMIVRPLGIGLAVGLAVWFGARLTGDGAMAWTVAAMIPVAAVALALLWKLAREHPPVPDAPTVARPTREWVALSLPFLLISVAQVVQGQTSLLALGWIDGGAPTGIYAAAARLMQLLNFGLVASNMMLAPTIAGAWAAGDRDKVQRMVTLAAVVVTGYTFVVGGALLLTGRFALGLFGQEFTSGYGVLTILIVGAALNSLAGPVGYLMSMTEHQWMTTRALAVGAVANVVLSVVLIPRFGIAGAAWADTLSTITWNAILLVACFPLLRIDPTVFGIFRFRMSVQ